MNSSSSMSITQRLREDAQRQCQPSDMPIGQSYMSEMYYSEYYPNYSCDPTAAPAPAMGQPPLPPPPSPAPRHVVQSRYQPQGFVQPQEVNPFQNQSVSHPRLEVNNHPFPQQSSSTSRNSFPNHLPPMMMIIQPSPPPASSFTTWPTTTTDSSTSKGGTVDVSQVRADWRKHGIHLSQALEELRTSSRNPCHLQVRIVNAVERQDPMDPKSSYTAYIIEVSTGSNNHHNNNTTTTTTTTTTPPLWMERRYSDFWKFKETSKPNINIPFPNKTTRFYKTKEALIADRMKQLDAWLVHAVVEYNQGRITDEMGFLTPTPLPHPYQQCHSCLVDNKEDIMELQTILQQILPKVRIPIDLWRTAVGMFLYTSRQMVPPARNGILIARRPHNSWSAPIAIQTVGMIGSNCSMIIITKESVIRDVCHGTRLDLGSTQDVLIPVGNNDVVVDTFATTSGSTTTTTSFTSLWTTVRTNRNAKFYGQQVQAINLIHIDGPTQISAARRLYEALQHVQLY